MIASWLSRAHALLIALRTPLARMCAVVRAAPCPSAPWIPATWSDDQLAVPHTEHADDADPIHDDAVIDTAPPLALCIRPPVDAPQDLTAMELTVQALALDGPVRTSAIALELVGLPDARAIVARAASSKALDYLARQIQARYPQCEVRRLTLDQDAFCLHDGEVLSARELRPTGRPYLSLRTWTPARGSRQEYQMGVDPLLGILAALGPLPTGMRAMVQLALTPATPSWSQGHLREADQHSLARARLAAVARERDSQVGSPLPLMGLLLVLIACWWLLIPAHHANRYPLIGPFVQALQQALHPATAKHVSAPSATALTTLSQFLPIILGWGIGLAILGAGAVLLFQRLRGGQHRHPEVIDPADIALKTQQPGYHARLRLYVFSPQGATTTEGRDWRERRQRVLDHLTATYRQFHRAGASSFAPHTISSCWAHQLIPEGPYWVGDRPHRQNRWTWGLRHSPTILSLAEVASLWHLPQAYDLPELPWMDQQNRAKTLFAPRAVMADIGSDPTQILGTSRHAGQQMSVSLTWESIRQHSLLVAKTGKGKSSLMLLLARLGLVAEPARPIWREQEPRIKQGPDGAAAPRSAPPGMILVDPHGDLATQLLGVIPASRRDDVLVLDLADTHHPPAINPLDVTLGRNRDKAVENLLLIFADIWDKGWGYRMENAMGFALKTLYAANETLVKAHHAPPEEQFTLLDVAPLLTLKKFRETTLLLVDDTTILDWWHTYFDKLYDRLRLDVINPVLTKVSKFSSSIIARRILGVPESSLDLTQVVREGKILIINTAQGVVGNDTARLVGATILGLLRVTLEEQAELDRGERRRLLVLVDEFQTLQGVDFGAMLSELRKFGASFMLATQALAYLDKLDPALRPTVLANIDNLFAFDMSADDARLLERELDGVVTTRDLINLDAFTCYAKITLAGRRLPVFSLVLAPPPIADRAAAQAIRQQSRLEIAPRSLAAIDELIDDLAARHPPEEDGKSGTNTPVGATTVAKPPPRTPHRSAAMDVAARRRQQANPRANFTGRIGIGYGSRQASDMLTTPPPLPEGPEAALSTSAEDAPTQRHRRGKRGSGRGPIAGTEVGPPS